MMLDHAAFIVRGDPQSAQRTRTTRSLRSSKRARSAPASGVAHGSSTWPKHDTDQGVWLEGQEHRSPPYPSNVAVSQLSTLSRRCNSPPERPSWEGDDKCVGVTDPGVRWTYPIANH